LIQFRKSEVRPAIARRSGERALELLLRLIEAASLQQSSGKRLPDRVIPIRRLSIRERVLQRGRLLEPRNGYAGIAFDLGDARQNQCLRDAKYLLCRDV